MSTALNPNEYRRARWRVARWFLLLIIISGVALYGMRQLKKRAEDSLAKESQQKPVAKLVRPPSPSGFLNHAREKMGGLLSEAAEAMAPPKKQKRPPSAGQEEPSVAPVSKRSGSDEFSRWTEDLTGPVSLKAGHDHETPAVGESSLVGGAEGRPIANSRTPAPPDPGHEAPSATTEKTPKFSAPSTPLAKPSPQPEETKAPALNAARERAVEASDKSSGRNETAGMASPPTRGKAGARAVVAAPETPAPAAKSIVATPETSPPAPKGGSSPTDDATWLLEQASVLTTLLVEAQLEGRKVIYLQNGSEASIQEVRRARQAALRRFQELQKEEARPR